MVRQQNMIMKFSKGKSGSTQYPNETPTNTTKINRKTEIEPSTSLSHSHISLDVIGAIDEI